MASTKRELPSEKRQPEIESKKPKLHPDHESPPPSSSSSETKPSLRRVVLNPADCDLDFNIEDSGSKGSALHEGGFAYCWSGARANVGITGGKYCFGCKIVSAQTVEMEDTPPDQQNVCRLGISRGDDAVGNLGETLHSFGFGGTGKFSTAGKFSDYGEKFGVGDTIVCAVDLQSKPLASIGFSKNGKWLGTAKQFDAGVSGLGVVESPMKEQQWGSGLFPHVLLKNVIVQLQFGVEEGLVPEDGYEPWASALDEGNAIMGPIFSNMRDCEIMMMVGLPASGKTTWAEKWVKAHPEKRYVLLGTNLVLDQMKVPGLLRKNNYGERFDRLMGRANVIFDTLLSRAVKTPRNYIVDQTNVFKSARKRKLRPFANFHKIAVVAFPKPEQLKFRADKRFKEMGKEVPSDVVNNMLANYVLPTSKDMPDSDEFFDQVIFIELDRRESQKYLEEMKRGLKTDSSPYSRESLFDSYAEYSLQNQGTSVSGGQWEGSYPAPPPPPAASLLSAPPRPLNYGCQISYPATCQGLGYSSGTYENYHYPSVPRAPISYNSYGRPVQRGYGGYLGDYGVIPGSAAAATTHPYQSIVADSSQVQTSSTSFASNTVGDPQATLQAPRAPLHLPRPSPSSYGSFHGTNLWYPSQSPRPSYGSFRPGAQPSTGYYPPPPPYH